MRCKVDKVVGQSSDSKLPICHFMVLNKKGNAIHFTHVLPHKDNHWAPWWFLGKWEGIPKVKQEKLLKRTGRRILFKTDQVFLFLVIFHIIYFALVIPWMIIWGLYPIWFTLGTWIKECPIFPWNWNKKNK